MAPSWRKLRKARLLLLGSVFVCPEHVFPKFIFLIFGIRVEQIVKEADINCLLPR